MGFRGVASTFGYAWRGIDIDQAHLLRIAGPSFSKNSSFFALITNDSIRAAFLMRVASRGGLFGRLSRSALIAGYSCDVSAGARIEGALHLPHPIGIVIGRGTRIVGDVTIFQGVTLGSDGTGGYPVVESGVRIFPNAVVVGGIRLGNACRISAGALVREDVLPGDVVRRS